VLVPVAGALVLAFATTRFPKIAREKGVESVIKALIIKDGVIPIKTTLFHMAAAIVSIGTGAPLGPEGPAAKIGSGMGSALSQWFGLNRENIKIYTAAGAGAAISAVFNAPIAGVFFAIEVVLLNDLKNESLSFLIIASIVADILSRAVLGNEAIFTIPDYAPIRFADLPWFLLLAVCCGMISLLYFGTSKTVKRLFEMLPGGERPWVRLVPVALIFGFVLLRFDALFGIGYITMNGVLNNAFTPATVLCLLLFRILFLALFLRAGAYGGTFAPALGMGVMFGFLFAVTINTLLGTSLDPVVFGLVSMGGVLAGINSIPLTSILLVFELTRDFRIVLPLMAASIIAYIVVIYVNKRTVYAHALLKEGIDVDAMRDVDLLGKIKVSQLMETNVESVSYRMPFGELLQRLLRSSYGELCVVDDDHRLLGVIPLKGVRQALITHEIVDLLIAGDLVVPVPPVTETDPVSTALKNIKQYDIENIPVVKSGAADALVGILRHQDILHAYNTMLEEWETHKFLATYRRDG
jgi:CIC family chloride channel protein